MLSRVVDSIDAADLVGFALEAIGEALSNLYV